MKINHNETAGIYLTFKFSYLPSYSVFFNKLVQTNCINYNSLEYIKVAEPDPQPNDCGIHKIKIM